MFNSRLLIISFVKFTQAKKLAKNNFKWKAENAWLRHMQDRPQVWISYADVIRMKPIMYVKFDGLVVPYRWHFSEIVSIWVIRWLIRFNAYNPCCLHLQDQSIGIQAFWKPTSINDDKVKANSMLYPALVETFCWLRTLEILVFFYNAADATYSHGEHAKWSCNHPCFLNCTCFESHVRTTGW